MKILPCEISKKGIICLWEWGGHSVNHSSGIVQLICDNQFRKKNAIFLKKELNGKHALIPVRTGDYALQVIQISDENMLKLWKLEIDIMLKRVIAEEVDDSSFSQFNVEKRMRFFRAAIDKVSYVNCDKPFWVNFR